jgi:hypothetical protein
MHPNWRDRFVLSLVFAKSSRPLPLLVRAKLGELLCPRGVQRHYAAAVALCVAWPSVLGRRHRGRAAGWPSGPDVEAEPISKW